MGHDEFLDFDLYGVVISGGLGELHGKLLRIGHMGHMAQPMYVVTALAALERTLHDLGHPVREFGAGVGAALRAMVAGTPY